MRKFVWLVMFMFLLVGTAKAELIGIPQYNGNLPDIKFDNNGRFVYDADSDLFQVYNSVDEKITLKDGSSVTLTDELTYNPLVGFGLAIHVNQSGNYYAGVDSFKYEWDTNLDGEPDYTYTSDLDMVEVLLTGTITVDGHTYSANNGPVLILGAEVELFGWEDSQYVNIFDFLFGPVSGAFVDDGIWPTSPKTGAFAYAGLTNLLDNTTWPGTWNEDFKLENKGGDKLPTPEPATLLMVGAGLMGIGFLGRRRIKKK